MTKQEIKKAIAHDFGFATNKIELLESVSNPYEYSMFEVCGITYKVRRGNLEIVR